MGRNFGSWLSVALAPLCLAAVAPPAGYDTLQDLWVFQSTPPTSWAGGDLVAPDSSVVVDTVQSYDGLPSLSFLVPGRSQGYWAVILPGRGWEPYSLEFYRANGALEFNIKGAAGGEHFQLTLTDVLPSRLDNRSIRTSSVDSADYVTATTEWQHVVIPLAAFQAPEGFRWRQMGSLQLSNASGGAYTGQFWLNQIRFTSPDTEPVYPAIKVNQLGYAQGAQKIARVSGFGELLAAEPGTPFEVLSAESGLAVYAGQLTLVTEYDEGVSGEKVLSADFTSVAEPGTYFLRVHADGVAESLTFPVGDGVLQPLLRATQRYYYYQRQGIEIAEPYAEGFPRGLGHPNDDTAQLRSNGATRDASHGWYAAGDDGKYVSDVSPAIATLLEAYALAPELFQDGQNNIPESGNGMPDLLDEVKWGLDWLMKMQDASSGGFYVQLSVGDCAPSGSCRPEDILAHRYIEDLFNGVGDVKPTAPTADAVAVLARASTVYQDYDAALAASYLAAAEAGWAYLQANPQNIQADAPGIEGNQTADDQDRMWAAAELFRATGEAGYSAYFLARYQAYLSTWTNTIGSASDLVMRAFYAYNLAAGADAAERDWFSAQFAKWRRAQLARTRGAWRNFMPLWGYYWGSNTETLQTATILALAAMGTTAPELGEIADAVQAQIDYILGVNPLRHSYVTGMGADSAVTIFSSIYPAYGIYITPPGYMPGGPDIHDNPWFSRFPARCYADTNTNWQVSEHDVSATAPLVFNAAFLEHFYGSANAQGNRARAESRERKVIR
jgi:endoglucanase